MSESNNESSLRNANKWMPVLDEQRFVEDVHKGFREISNVLSNQAGHIESLQKDVRRILVLVDDQKIERDLAIVKERQDSYQRSWDERFRLTLKADEDKNKATDKTLEEIRKEIDRFKMKVIGALSGFVGIVLLAALAIVFKIGQ